MESPWSVGAARRTHAFDTAGVTTSAPGATLTLRALQPGSSSATLTKSIPADALRMKRVRLSGSIRSSGVTQASLWMRVDAPSGMLLLYNGSDRALRGTQDWTEFSVTLPVPSSASRVLLGLLMVGGGEIEARDVRVESVGVIDVDAPMHPDAKALVDSAITVARNRSVWRDTLSWDRIMPEVRTLAAGASSLSDAFPALRVLATRLGDKHSSFMPPTTAQAFRTGGSQNPEPTLKAFDNSVGYINVPAYSGGDPSAIQKYAQNMHAGLQALAPSVRCGWIVDLRQNGGGNMYPMLAGLRPFLGDSTLGYFVSTGNKVPWNAASRSVPKHPGELDTLSAAYVAVLTGPRTASSGEIVAISFRERARTRSFGLPTGGYSTANSMVPLPGGATLNITTAIDADRSGNLFGHAIDPDERIDIPVDGTGDETLSRATNWLIRESGCGSR